LHAENCAKMKKTSLLLLFMVCGALPLLSTVYTRVGARPQAGWAGKYLIVCETSDTKAYVWNGEDASSNYVQVTIANGKITADNLADYLVTVAAEGNNYSVKTADGYIYTDAKSNGLEFAKGAHECTIKENGGYVILETNTNTCRFVYNTTSNRFRFYYDKDKKWDGTNYKNIRFYVEGDQEIVPSSQTLDINYAQAEMYACDSKFPTQSNPNYQYYSTFLWLLQQEDEEAVPQVGLEILAPTQYSIAGTYKSDYSNAASGYINLTAGSKHSFYIFPSKAEAGYSTASINVAEMKISKVGKSEKANTYTYHIKLEFTDSNKKIWTLDKDLDVYAWWIDCDRSGKENVDMDPVAFALESGNHQTQEDEEDADALSQIQDEKQSVTKYMQDGVLYIRCNDRLYTAYGMKLTK